MIITKMALPRRTFLRGVGATLALPLVDAMIPALSAMRNTAARPVPRLGFIMHPNGVIQDRWVPATVGTNFEFPPILRPIEGFRDQLLIVSGLAHRQAETFGDGNGDHPRAVAAWLSGVHAWNRRGGAEVKLGTTADQLAARVLGQDTRVPSLEMALEGPTAIACDTGDCFYGNTISWRTPTTPLPMEGHPRMVFARLFGDGGSAAQQAKQSRKAFSILDSVTKEATRLQKTLGPSDRMTLTQYLEAVRDVEQRIHQAERRSVNADLALPERPVDIPDRFEDHARIMFDLQVLAYQGDITRVFSLMMGRETSRHTFPQLGVPEEHHAVSHHRNVQSLIEKKAKIDTFHMEIMRYFLEKLRATPDGDGSLLDHSMIVYGGGLGDGDLHSHTNLPCLVAGGGGGQLEGGRHLEYPENTPMTSLLLSVLMKAGVEVERLGDSTGRLDLDTGPLSNL